MEDKNRCSKIANNKFSFERFIRFFVVIEILLVFLYTRHIATFSVYGSKIWLLACIITVFAGGSLILSWKFERNWVSLISGTILPVLLYEATSMCKYSFAARIIIIVGGVGSISIGIFWAATKVSKIKRVSRRREAFIIKSARASRIICCMVLLGVCIYGKSLIATHYSVSYSDITYDVSGDYYYIPDYGNSLTANIATAAKIDPDGGWGALSVEEKTEVLETIIRIECRYLGMRDSAPSLELAYLEEGLLGEYEHVNDIVTLSYNYVVDSGSSGYSVVQVLCHELYHRYQLYQVNLLEALRTNSDTDKYADLLLLDTAEIYEEEMSNYMSPATGSTISYYQYSSQEMERDAEKYGNASMVDYYEKIRSYFGYD